LAYYAEQSGNSVPTFGTTCQTRLQAWRSWPIGCPKTSVQSYHSALRTIPEERKSRRTWSFGVLIIDMQRECLVLG
jgi:hypothetical protein